MTLFRNGRFVSAMVLAAGLCLSAPSLAVEVDRVSRGCAKLKALATAEIALPTIEPAAGEAVAGGVVAGDHLGRPDAARRPVTIVAIGSSSTEGIPSNDKAKLYPATMQAALQKLWPEADVRVLNKGRGGENIPQTLARFDRDVLALRPALVIWQLGVNDVLQMDGVEDRRALIAGGLKRLAEAGIPTMLLDLQYAPSVLGDPDTDAMQRMIEAAAADPGVTRAGPHARVFHFKRFAVMKELAEKEGVAMSDMIVADGLHMTDQMHACVGDLLAASMTRRRDQQIATQRITR
jgi:lysophospholipase L1-like esterase